VPLDTEAIRQECQERCRQAKDEFERAQRAWTRHRDEEEPAFNRWRRSSFGPELEAIRRLEEQLSQKRRLLELVRIMAEISGRPERRVYLEVLEQQQAGKSLDEIAQDFDRRHGLDDPGDAEDDDFETPRDEDDDEDGFDDFREGFEELFGEGAGGFFDDFARSLGLHSRRRPGDQAAGQRLKEIYRELCRQLHPDTGCEFNERNSALWHEIQDAYNKRDLERLELLRARFELEGGGAKTARCSHLLALAKDYQDGAAAAANMVRKAKSSPAWGFLSWKATQRKKAEKKVAAELALESDSLRRELCHMVGLFQRWEKPYKAKERKQRPPDDFGLEQLVFRF